MGMSLGGNKRAEINVTPMIDILLVLVIIFMVITPTTSRGLHALVPQPAPNDTRAEPVDDTIVVTVNGDQTVDINHERVPMAELRERLDRLFHAHLNHVLFVRGNKDLEFQQVADVISIAREVGLDRVALMTQK